MSSSLPTCPLTPRIRSCHPWLWVVTCVSAAHGTQIHRSVRSAPLGLGGTVAIQFLAALPWWLGMSSCLFVKFQTFPPKELWASIHWRGNKANARIWTTTTINTSSRTTDAWPNSKTYPYELIHLGMFVSINLQFLPRAKPIYLLFSTSIVTARKSVRFQTVKRCNLMKKSIRCPRNLQSPNNQETVTSIKCYTNGPVLVAAPCTMWTVLFYVHRCN